MRALRSRHGLDRVALQELRVHPLDRGVRARDDVLRAALEHLPDRVVLRLLRPGALHLVVGPAAEQQRAAALAHPRAHVLALDVVEVARGPAAVLEAAAAVLVSVGGRLHDAVEGDVVDDLDRAHAGTTRLTANDRALRVGEDGGAADAVVGGRGDHTRRRARAARSAAASTSWTQKSDVHRGVSPGWPTATRSRGTGCAARRRRSPGRRNSVDRPEAVGLPAEDGAVEGVAASVSGVESALIAHAPGSLTTWAPRWGSGSATMKTAPAGSASVAVRPTPGTSAGSASTVPPASRARAAASSALSTHTWVRQAGSSPLTKPATSRPRSVQTRCSPRRSASQPNSSV